MRNAWVGTALLLDDHRACAGDLDPVAGQCAVVVRIKRDGHLVLAKGKGADGLTPLHRAVQAGHTDTIKALLNAEVPVDEPTADGRKPIELAPDLKTKEVLGKFSRKTEL